MAERKSGPVKPPVVELTARPVDKPAEAPNPAAAGATEARPAAGDKASPPKPGRPPTPAEERRPGQMLPLLGGIAGGALVGIAVCYGLAYEGYWPGPTAASDSRLATLEQRLGQDGQATAKGAGMLTALGVEIDKLRSDTAAKLGAGATALDAVQQDVKRLSAAPVVDAEALQGQVKTLSSRLDAVAAGASSADAGALAANVATLQTELAELTRQVGALADRTGAGETAVQNLKGELDGARAAIDKAAAAPSRQAIAAAMQLPLLISALDADLAGGRPYAADLASLTAALPQAEVPASVTAAAATGLPAPQELVDAFEARVPEMLAARPAAGDAGVMAQAGGWLRNILALRRQGEQPGDGADAVLSRLEGALNRHDFAGAVALLGQLPQPMQQAAGDVAAKLRGLAEAQHFIANLRQTALAPAAEVQQ